MRVTKHGVRDLNAKQRNGRVRACSHVFTGQVIVGWRYESPFDFEQVPVYSQQCVVCRAVRP